MLKNLIRWVGTLIRPRPTLYDLMIGCFLIVPFLAGKSTQASFIIFYSFFLALVGFMLKPKREYNSIPLMLLIIWSLASIFLHNDLSFLPGAQHNLYNYNKNLEFAMEGFLFIFAAGLLIMSVVRHATNLRFMYILIPFAFIPWLKNMEHWGSMTPMFGVLLSICIYLLLTKRFKLVCTGVLIGLGIMIKNWEWVCMKFACRPLILNQLNMDMFYGAKRVGQGVNGPFVLDPGIRLAPFLERFLEAHNIVNIKPWLASLIGNGFPHRLLGNYTWVDKDVFGWSYNMNDFLALGKFIGPIGLGLLLWFVLKSFKKIGVSYALIPFMAIMLICTFQMTMFNPGKAGLFLIIGTMCLWEGYNKEVTL